MNTVFDIAAGSVIGREHRRLGRNNQDAYAVQAKLDRTIAVVCDGCGSSPHSEVGAQLGARWVVASLDRQCERGQPKLQDPDFWPELQQELLNQIRQVATGLGSALETVIWDYFLFTIVGVIVTAEITVIFSLGDGVAMLNEEVLLQGTIADNRPPYLAYGLFPNHFSMADLQFTVYPRSTATVNTLLIGTDGVQDLAKTLDPLLADVDLMPEMFTPFWQDDRYFRNPDQVRRYLVRCNREVIQPNWQTQVLERQSGLLEDDTTLVLMRRKSREVPLC
ncbi:protein phosphatase 2C domain-containing protein [Trichothermofontia sichuanensis B231]|uniref:protein phosphatase 2C domain-containing protein n=1 Tax=Trichothermofontia sichuanensis TaxID=3045816 RepID=UPI002246612B|nr:protein phosphatase 2C domain-containing protein [Trichothermofontia sichuanensis]UZQ54390.1 protein phosphatase 2C domain-containing protein [Trichothermofontia sichuanensis B231]